MVKCESKMVALAEWISNKTVCKVLEAMTKMPHLKVPRLTGALAFFRSEGCKLTFELKGINASKSSGGSWNTSTI